MSHFSGWRGAKAARRISQKPGEMNKTEALYAAHLELQKRGGLICDWAFEPLTLRLADNTTYRVDFLVQTIDDLLEVHEVKGEKKTAAGKMTERWEDDAKVKFKVAREAHPYLTFRSVRKAGPGERGGWIISPPPGFPDPGAVNRALPPVQPTALGEVAGDAPTPGRINSAVAEPLREAPGLESLIAEARRRTGGAEIALYSMMAGGEFLWHARWRRLYECCGPSDERQLECPSLTEALRGIIEWEERADLEDGGKCPYHGLNDVLE